MLQLMTVEYYVVNVPLNVLSLNSSEMVTMKEQDLVLSAIQSLWPLDDGRSLDWPVNQKLPHGRRMQLISLERTFLLKKSCGWCWKTYINSKHTAKWKKNCFIKTKNRHPQPPSQSTTMNTKENPMGKMKRAKERNNYSTLDGSKVKGRRSRFVCFNFREI